MKETSNFQGGNKHNYFESEINQNEKTECKDLECH